MSAPVNGLTSGHSGPSARFAAIARGRRTNDG